jgi:hypothetical protein
MSLKKSVLIAAIGLTLGLGVASGASADSRWERHHPRREEINNRLERQNDRIRHERREGELTGAQAHELRAEDRGIRAQERFHASRNGGHLTRAEQHRLNREENGVSHQIGR